ncbi:uncharacterized protein LOC135473477 [Liolophura sinensis]|uniref:uncharacterized protein LOC135473477 n=1 Tax=Liolophura sinensis TaxID=3198878 RepID=UPI0031593193
MKLMIFVFLGCLLSVVNCENYTVTDEVWFDIEIRDFDGAGDDYRGRFVIGLFGDTVPMTALNFASIANGYERKKKKIQYKGTHFHRIVPDFVIQGGDTTHGDGQGGEAIFCPQFVDENFHLSHKAAGYVSMANHGPDTNGSQFFIILSKARWLDKKHVVFGKVVNGMDVIRTIGTVETDEFSQPKKRVKIIDCGADEVKKYTLTEGQTLSDQDIER